VITISGADARKRGQRAVQDAGFAAIDLGDLAGGAIQQITIRSPSTSSDSKGPLEHPERCQTNPTRRRSS
jgi:hypothetical protein